MKHLLLRLIAAVFAAIVVVIIFAWLTLRASLPQLDGEAVADGLSAETVIERDADGIPTIRAGSRQDLAFATGYAHGQDRFFQMDLVRRRSAGELSALIGEATLKIDRRNRLHRFRSRARSVLEALDPTEREMLERYAAGVNAGLASLDARPFEYYIFGEEPAPWLAEDSVLVVYTMFLELNDSRARRDVRRGLAHRILPDAMFAWMYPLGTAWDAPLTGPPVPELPVPSRDLYSVRKDKGVPPPNAEQGKVPLPGSNNWAVGGALTTSGRALVSNDMHLSHAAPNIYYQARLIVEGEAARDVTGVTLPGAPFVVAGSNGRVAWGYTNSHGDWSDAVLLRPGASPDSYQTPVGDMPFSLFEERIEVRGGSPEMFQLRETIWGPVIDDISYPDGDIVVSWIAHAPEAVNLRLTELETASSVVDALDIANRMGIPPQNFVTGDAEGNIGWTIAGRIPKRSPHYDPTLPADWSQTQGWQGWLPAEAYPRIVNPDSHRIWTANARVAEGDALRLIGHGAYDLGARARQIRDALFARDRFEPVDMLDIQNDDRALFLSPWRELLLETLAEDVIANDPQLEEYRQIVSDWLPRAAPDSAGYRLVRAFRLEVQARVFHGLTGPLREAYGADVALRLSNQFEAPLWSLVTRQPEHLLNAEYANWDELLLSAVRANVAYFSSNFDGPLSARTWGERNTARIRHPLSAILPWFEGFLDMPPDPLSGDSDLPRAQGPTFGASERFSVAPGDERHGLMHMPTGQSGHPMSAFYRRGHDDWVKGAPSPFLPGLPAHSLTLLPGEAAANAR